MKQHFTTKKLVLAAFFMALGFVLPFLTGSIPEIGSRLLPMHIAAMLCGFVCGPYLALVVGFATPLLRSLIFAMPPMFPTAVSMAFELAAYGVLCALLYRALPKKPGYIYLTLIGSMIGGRVVWGLVRLFIMGVGFDSPFTWAYFLKAGFVDAIPGLIVQIVLIPVIILALEKAKVLQNGKLA